MSRLTRDSQYAILLLGIMTNKVEKCLVTQPPDGGTPSAKDRFRLQLRARERRILSKFFGREISVPLPPSELCAVMARAGAIGWHAAEAHFLPPEKLERDVKIPGWTDKPEPWFWDKVKDGEILGEAGNLGGVWVIIDGACRPIYMKGDQMYFADPFAPVLSQLRSEGKIKVPQGFEHIPATSRFGISYDELQVYVLPTIADYLGVDLRQVRVPRVIEYNVLGNMGHREWGITDTWEYLTDRCVGDDHLAAGNLIGAHGLSHFSFGKSSERISNVGFRPMVVFKPRPPVIL